MGLLDFDANKLAGNPLLQVGMGILANNSGNYGQFAPAFGKGVSQGMQNANMFAQQQQQNELLKQRADMQNQEFAFKKSELERAQQNEAKKRDATQRLVKGKPSYYSTPDGMQNANYEPVFNQNQYAQDLVDAGYGGELIKQQLTPKEIKAYKPGDVLYRGSEKIDAIPDAVDYNKAFLPDGTPNSAYQQWALRNSKAGASNQTTIVGTDKKYGEILGGKLAEQDAAAIDAARSAPDRLSNARNVKNILQTNPITGTGAEWRLSANKALATAGLIDGNQVKNTEDLASTLAAGTLDAIKTSGLGAGQGFTDKDRQFLEKARSGNIEINAGTLKTLADMNERAAIKSIERGNNVVRSIKSDPNSGNIGSRLEEIQIPDYVEPAKKTVSLQDIMDTAKASGKTTAQVTKDLKAKGYSIGK